MMGTLKRIVITPSDKVLKVDSSVLFKAVGYNETNHEMDIQPTWNSTLGSFSAQNSNTTLFTAYTEVGSGVVVASVGNVKGYANVTLVMREITHIKVHPNTTQVVAGGYRSFSCYGYDEYSNNVEVQPNWVSSLGDMVNNTLIAQTNVATGNVSAWFIPPNSQKMLYSASSVTIVPEDVYRIEITPRLDEAAVGSIIDFNATGYDKYNNIVAAEIDWETNEGNKLQELSPNSTEINFTTTPGTGYVKAEYDEDIYDRIDIDIIPSELETILVTPNRTTVNAGRQATFYASGYDAYGNKIDIDEFDWFWHLGDEDSSYGYSATYTAPGNTGNYTIYATYDDVWGSAEMNVVPADVNSIEILPPKGIEVEEGVLRMMAGGSYKFGAECSDAFGNHVGSGINWSSSAGIFVNDIFYAQTKTASGTISANCGSVYSVVNVVIDHAELESIDIEPKDVKIDISDTQEFTAVGFDKYGNVVDIKPEWRSDVGLFDPAYGSTTSFRSLNTPDAGYIKANFTDGEFSIEAVTTIEIVDMSSEELKILGKIPDQIVEEDSQFWYLYLRPYENKPFSKEGLWYVSGEDKDLFTIKGENSTNDILIFTPLPDAFGDNMVTLWVWNEQGESDSQKIWINITPVNDPPRIENPPDIRISYHEEYVFDYAPYIVDVDTSCDFLSITAWDTSWSERRLLQKNEFNITYKFDSSYLNTSVKIDLELSDCNSITVESVEVFITENIPPRVNPMNPALENIVLHEDGVPRTFHIGNHFEEPEGGELSISYSHSHVNISIENNDKVIMWAGTEWSGTEVVIFKATDEEGAFCEDWIYVTVIPNDDPPVISRAFPKLVVHYDEDYLFNLAPYITDVDTPLEELVVSTDNPYVSVQHGTNLVLVVNFPEEYYQDTFNVLVNISDAHSQDSAYLNIKVTDNSIPWLIQAIPDISFKEDTTHRNAINLREYFFDPDGDPLNFVTENENVLIFISLYGDVTFSASKNWFGQEQVIFRALDKQLAFVETTITVTVEAVPDAPTMDQLDPIFIKNGSLSIDLMNYNLEDIDSELDSLEITAISNDPDLLVFINGQDVFIIVDSDAKDSFNTYIEINVSDGDNSISQRVPVEAKVKDPVAVNENSFELLIMFIIIAFILLALFVGAYLYFYRGFYKIDEIYLVYKDGRLIFHKLRPGLDQKDEDIVTSMLTAIQEFVEETFSAGGGEEGVAIKKMQFGGRTIVIEKGENIYIAIILKGMPGIRLQRQMAWAINHIEEDYKKELKRWNGVVSKLSGVYKYINIFIKTKDKTSENVNFIDLTR